MKKIIPLATMERLMKHAGASRISEDAKKELAILLEEYGMELTRKAITLARHAKRNTIRSDDLKLATRHARD
jgi:DNA-binding protein